MKSVQRIPDNILLSDIFCKGTPGKVSSIFRVIHETFLLTNMYLLNTFKPAEIIEYTSHIDEIINFL